MNAVCNCGGMRASRPTGEAQKKAYFFHFMQREARVKRAARMAARRLIVNVTSREFANCMLWESKYTLSLVEPR